MGVGTIAGVDLAASPRSTGVAVLDGRVVREVEVGTDDARIETLCHDAERIGIDCPFGWPTAFVDFVSAHQNDRRVPRSDSIEARRPLAYRATDLWWLDRGLRPLSVSADRIAHAAFRCAGLLSRLTDDPDRSGAGRVVETYPAGSLSRWAPVSRGYKGRANRARLAELATHVIDTAGLRFRRSTDEELVRTSDHAFDAVVAALTAASALEPVPDEHSDAARVEGWIRMPSGPLSEVL
ncbi:MAG: DUF429 domain-containing protein [Williamsia herbipolensis]|nr:DUF429 domain-containing protein [Williamsia herbipolensis]